MAVQSRRVKLIADCLLGVAERFYRRISICGATLRYWRKRVRVERTIDTARRQSPVLKTGRVTGPPSLPHRTGPLTAPAHEAVHTHARLRPGRRNRLLLRQLPAGHFQIVLLRPRAFRHPSGLPTLSPSATITPAAKYFQHLRPGPQPGTYVTEPSDAPACISVCPA